MFISQEPSISSTLSDQHTSVGQQMDESESSSRSTTPTPTNPTDHSAPTVTGANNSEASEAPPTGTTARSDEENAPPSSAQPPSSRVLRQASPPPIQGSSRDVMSAPWSDPTTRFSSKHPGAGMMMPGMYDTMSLGGGLGSIADLDMSALSDPLGLGMMTQGLLGHQGVGSGLADNWDLQSPQWQEALKSVGIDVDKVHAQMKSKTGDVEEDDGVSVKTSHPPRSKHENAGADLALYFTSSYWGSPWFQSITLEPDVLQYNHHKRVIKSWNILDTAKHIYIGVLFSDLSICWGHVGFYTDWEYQPGSELINEVERDARYIPPPKPLDEVSLIDASKIYGPIIAGYAESALSARNHYLVDYDQDLASAALIYVEQCESIPRPVPSIRGTFGHLIFEGRAYSKDDVRGRWRGGDSVVRRGDILRWKKAKVTVIGKKSGSSKCVGGLDHTAILVEDCIFDAEPKDGELFSPKGLRKMAVITEIDYKGPRKTVYDMTGFQEGEMWIYRPVGMKVYLGIDDLRPRAPSEEEGVKTCGEDRKGKGVAR